MHAPRPEYARPPVRMSPWRRWLHEVVFEADTPAGLAFDAALLVAIVLSVTVVMLASVQGVVAEYGELLFWAEWVFTVLFTVEYALRLMVVARPALYARSFYGVVDLLSILPTWASLFVEGAESLLVVRLLRMMRIFRVFKLANHLEEGRTILLALQRSARKITVFMTTVLALITIVGAVMYVVEGPEYGFTSIPVGMYWAAVTITTVGYGDISPGTSFGRFLAMFVMLIGYAIIAVPTGIVSAEMVRADGTPGQDIHNPHACPGCGAEGHHEDASYCRVCGTPLLFEGEVG